MPEARLERTRRSYDRVIDMGPYACKLLDVGNPDHQALNRVWERDDRNTSTRRADSAVAKG